MLGDINRIPLVHNLPARGVHQKNHGEPEGTALGFAAYGPALALGLIWLAHIGFDRALGYGLKSASGFRDTHLGAPGRSREG